MTSWLLRWVVSGIALAIVANLGIGVKVDNTASLAMATVVIGLVNSLIRPILVLLTLPLTCLTFGLFGLLLNALLFWGVQLIVPGFHVDTFLGAALGPILMSILSGLLGSFLPDGKKD